MGGAQSLPSDICLDDFLGDLANLYPNIEVQLEDAYVACTGCDDIDAVNQGLDYEDVEPVVRHFLFNLGFGEFLTRFCNGGEKLDPSEIKPLLKQVGVHVNFSSKLNLDDWKIMLLAWVRKCQQASADDHAKWLETIDNLQHEQQQKLSDALRGFEKAYLSQIEAYHKAVEAQFKQEESLRRQWESQQDAKDRFHDSQMVYLEDMNKAAEANYAQRLMRAQNNLFVSSVRKEAEKLELNPLDGAEKAFAFLYPTDKIPTGAPISGGACMPHKVGGPCKRTRKN